MNAAYSLSHTQIHTRTLSRMVGSVKNLQIYIHSSTTYERYAYHFIKYRYIYSRTSTGYLQYRIYDDKDEFTFTYMFRINNEIENIRRRFRFSRKYI